MFIPPGQTINAVTFFRNDIPCVQIGVINGKCATFPSNSIYTCECSSRFSYTLTIPAENMTEFENGSVWRCEYFGDGRFHSLSATLHIAGELYTYHRIYLMIVGIDLLFEGPLKQDIDNRGIFAHFSKHLTRIMLMK